MHLGRRLWYTQIQAYSTCFASRSERNLPMKKLFCMLAACACLFAAVPRAAAENTGYADVPQGLWCYPYVLDLSQKGIVSGYPDGSFRPNGMVSCGEALKLILRAADYPEMGPEDGHWAGGYRNLAVQSGFLPQTDTYDLDRAITRTEVAQLAARALGLRLTMTGTPFADCSDPEVLALYQSGIIEGMSVDGELCFCGDQPLLRSQISAIIWRMEGYEPAEEGGILTPGGPVPPEAEIPGEEPPAQPPEETGPAEPPKTIIYNSYTVDVLEDVPVFAYDPNDFYLEDGRMNCADPGVRLVHGVDVSSYQGAVDWERVKNDGIDFAILRVGYRGYTVGSLNKDTYFELNAHNAARAGLDVGVYIFSQAITVEEALEEADFVLEAIRDCNITGPVVFDWEVIGKKEARTYGLDTDTLCAAANAFCSRIREAGYQPMIYFNAYAGYVKYDLSRVLDYPFWFAQYKAQPDFYYDFQLWQYTSSGKVDGIQGNVDMDVWLLPNN